MPEAGKVAPMEKINDVINFAGSMFEHLPQLNSAMALFALWCGLGLVGVIHSRKRSSRMQKQLDKLGRDVRQLELQLELAENRRLMELLNSSSCSGSRMHKQDASSIIPAEERNGGD
jgi:hypothetical protein